MQIQTTAEDHRIAWLSALAITIHIMESAIPAPLPGLKPGRANVITITYAVTNYNTSRDAGKFIIVSTP